MSKQVWIDVTGVSIDGCVVARGGVQREHRVLRRSGEGEESLERRRARLGDEIASCLEGLGVRGGRVRVLWRDEGAGATVTLGPEGATAREAEAAAGLSLIESGTADPSAQAVSLRAIGAGEDGKENVVASVFEPGLDREIRGAVESAGARLGTLVAGDAAGVPRAITGVSTIAGSDPVASVVLGEQSSAIVVSSGGQVRLARFAGVGLSSLRESLAYALPAGGEGEEPALARADRHLRETGVPRPGGELEPGAPSGAALRSMQPALQRAAVELKQSIRFTLDASERMRVRVGVFGPAGAIAGLEGLLAEQVEGEPAGAALSPEDANWTRMALACGVGAWAGAKVRDPGTVSGGGVGTLLAGAACAAAAIGALGAAATVRVGEIEPRVERARSEVGALREASMSAGELAAAAQERALSAAIASEFGTATDFGAALRLTASAAEGVVLEGVRGARRGDASEGGSRLELRGRATGGTAEDARAALQGFIKRLDASPLTSGVEIGPTRLREPEDGDASAQFTAVVSLHERRPGEEGDR